MKIQFDIGVNRDRETDDDFGGMRVNLRQFEFVLIANVLNQENDIVMTNRFSGHGVDRERAAKLAFERFMNRDGNERGRISGKFKPEDIQGKAVYIINHLPIGIQTILLQLLDSMTGEKQNKIS